MIRVMGVMLSVALMLAAVPAYAELQQVELSGSIHIRGDFINNMFSLPPQARYTPFSTMGRPIGGPAHPAVVSATGWDDANRDFSAYEQRTRLGVKADFTDQVSTFIEFDSFTQWGEDFRSAQYLSGVDGRGTDNINLYQSYIDAKELGGTPLSLRVGRQELVFGSGWLIGNRETPFLFTGLSFDAIRLTYAVDTLSVDAWAAKLAENAGDWGEDDINFYGVYGSYKGIENHTIDAYYLLLEDDTLAGTTLLNTVGLRFAGKTGALDYDLEAAYQFGQADALGFVVGDNNADWDSLGLKADVGYAFDVAWQPRVFTSFRYYGGEDNRDISFGEWLCPWDKQRASVSFNRLFSNDLASGFMDLNTDLSNAWLTRLGVMAAPTAKFHGVLALTYYEAVEAFDRPVVPILTWWTTENDKDLGWELTLFTEYVYSQDLTFEAGWTHMFVGDGLEQGSFSTSNGTMFNGGTDDDGSDYAYLGAKISF